MLTRHFVFDEKFTHSHWWILRTVLVYEWMWFHAPLLAKAGNSSQSDKTFSVSSWKVHFPLWHCTLFNVTVEVYFNILCCGITLQSRYVRKSILVADLWICLHLSEWQICIFWALTIVLCTLCVSTTKNKLCSYLYNEVTFLNWLHWNFLYNCNN